MRLVLHNLIADRATVSWLFVFFGSLLFVAYNSIVLVAGRQIAVVERRWFGRKMPQGRVVGMSGEVGVQARTLGPGLHFLIPFLFVARKTPFLEIATGEVGIVESIDGVPIPAGRIFARVVAGHNAFQDGEEFLRNGGQKGPQIQILPPGNYRINPFLFNVKKVEAVVIDKGKIGVVTSMDGQQIPSGRLLGASVSGHSNFENSQVFLESGGQKGPQLDILLPGTYRINSDLFRIEIVTATVVPPNKVGLVSARDGCPLPEGEFIAKSVPGHNDYQNGQQFLLNGGQRGPQLDVIRPGTYYINPLMFAVEIDEIEKVERGQVAVHIANVGEPPTEEMKLSQVTFNTADFAVSGIAGERYVVPTGYRGIQQEVAGPGHYYLNRRAFIPHIIDTTNQTFEWDDSKKTRFDSLKVISKDGFQIEINVKVVVRVWPEQSPYLVAKVGSMENLALNVLHPMIESLFRTQASSISAMNFLLNRQEEQTRAEERARAQLTQYHVECVSVLICQVSLPQELMQTQTRRIIAEQQKQMFARQEEAEAARVATEKTRATADQQKDLVKAEIESRAAHEVKARTVTIAEGEARKIEIISQAKADAYLIQSQILGQQAITAIEMVKQVADGKVKITPDILVGGEKGNLLDVVFAQLARNGGLLQPAERPSGGKDQLPLDFALAKPTPPGRGEPLKPKTAGVPAKPGSPVQKVDSQKPAVGNAAPAAKKPEAQKPSV